MASETQPNSEANTKEKQVRITQQGKMKSYIANCLRFLENEEEDQFIVLHTLPHLPDDKPLADLEAHTISPKAASLVTSVVPRLLSVVEILKREYVKLLETTKSPRMLGLHQYNEIGTLEELGFVVGSTEGDADDVRRTTDIIQALSGKNHLRQTQTPFMRMTLSKLERPDLLAKGATYQQPNVRKVSKTAKARAKKRARTQQIKDIPMEDTAVVA